MSSDFSVTCQILNSITHFLPDSPQLIWEQGTLYEQEGEKLLKFESIGKSVEAYRISAWYKERYLNDFQIETNRNGRILSLVKTFVKVALILKNIDKKRSSRMFLKRAIPWLEILKSTEEYSSSAVQNLQQIHLLLDEMKKL